MYSTPYESPAEFQWDPDSAPHQAVNCGPSSVEKVANYFRNLATYGIERTRRLAASHGGGTNLGEQKLMLAKRGVSASTVKWSLAQIRAAIRTARRPIVIWLDMSRVPAGVRRTTFTGRHAMVALGLGTGTCPVHRRTESGIWIMDPDFHRDRPLHPPRLFYPDHVVDAASAAMGRLVVAPDKAKVLTAPRPAPRPTPAPTPAPSIGTAYVRVVVITASSLIVRSAPARTAGQLTTVSRGQRLTTRRLVTNGGAYLVGSTTRRDWIQVTANGRTGWIARGWTKLG